MLPAAKLFFNKDLLEKKSCYILYSVTQSNANSFWGYVVLDTSNNVSRDEDNILDQIYRKQMCSEFYYEDLKFWEWLKKMHI